MNHEIKKAPSTAPIASSTPSTPHQAPSTSETPSQKVVLSPGEWIRAVSNVDAPFGFDRMPTVWG